MAASTLPAAVASVRAGRVHSDEKLSPRNNKEITALTRDGHTVQSLIMTALVNCTVSNHIFVFVKRLMLQNLCLIYIF